MSEAFVRLKEQTEVKFDGYKSNLPKGTIGVATGYFKNYKNREAIVYFNGKQGSVVRDKFEVLKDEDTIERITTDYKGLGRGFDIGEHELETITVGTLFEQILDDEDRPGAEITLKMTRTTIAELKKSKEWGGF